MNPAPTNPEFLKILPTKFDLELSSGQTFWNLPAWSTLAKGVTDLPRPIPAQDLRMKATGTTTTRITTQVITRSLGLWLQAATTRVITRFASVYNYKLGCFYTIRFKRFFQSFE